MRLPYQSDEGRTHDRTVMYQELFAHAGLSLERLRTLCEVAEAGGISKAAQGDPTRQSQFSRQVRELESFFETKLTVKKGRRVAMTAEGRRLAGLAREVLSTLSDFKRRQSSGLVELTLGTGEAMIQWLILPRMYEINRGLRGALVGLRNLQTQEIVRQVQDETLDFGIVRTDAVTAGFCSRPLGKVTYRLFVPRSWGQSRSGAGWQHALELPVIALEGEGQLLTKLRTAAAKHGLRLKIALLCSSLPAIASAIMHTPGVAVLPRLAEASLAGERLISIPAPFLREFDRPLSLIWSPRQAKVRSIVERAHGILAEILTL